MSIIIQNVHLGTKVHTKLNSNSFQKQQQKSRKYFFCMWEEQNTDDAGGANQVCAQNWRCQCTNIYIQSHPNIQSRSHGRLGCFSRRIFLESETFPTTICFVFKSDPLFQSNANIFTATPFFKATTRQVNNDEWKLSLCPNSIDSTGMSGTAIESTTESDSVEAPATETG